MAWLSEPGARPRPLQLFGAVGHDAAQPRPATLDADFTLSPDDPIFGGHYPHFPLLPGVCLIEAALQLLEARGLAGPAPGTALLRIADLRLSAAVLPGMTVSLAMIEVAVDAGEQAWQCRFRNGARALGSLTLVLGRPGPAPRLAPAPPLVRPSTLGPQAIANRLAHRPPILLVDRATVDGDGRRLHARKLVSLNEPCYARLGAVNSGAQLAYPACLLAESFVQACALLVTEARPLRPDDEVMILGGIRGFSLHSQARPGDCLRHELTLQRLIADTALVSGVSRAGGRLVARFSDVLVAIRPAGALAGRTD